MKSTFKLFIILAAFIFAGSKLMAQDDMTPPKPVDNKILEGMVGDWTGESEMMGMKYTEEAKIYWTLNHQYLIMETKYISKDNSSIVYNGMGIVGVSKDNSIKMWWFDDWGADASANGTGTFGNNSFHVLSSNPMYTDDRTFELKDGNIVCNWSSTMKDKDGKDMSMKGSTTYKKK